MQAKFFVMKKLLLLLSLSLIACSTCKVANVSRIKEIQFGEGGGITGQIRTYSLKNDGKICIGEKQIKVISSDSISAILDLAEHLPKENSVMPSNTFNFIRLILEDKTYYYVWSIENMPDTKVLELYKRLKIQL